MGGKGGNTKKCSNCKRDIAVGNFVVHELHCVRHIAVCDICREPVTRSELQNHIEEEHTDVTCDLCNQPVPKSALKHHKENVCSKRPLCCEYCELECLAETLTAHTEYCESRTERCPNCNVYVKKRDQVRHDESKCQYPATRNFTSQSVTAASGTAATAARAAAATTAATATSSTATATSVSSTAIGSAAARGVNRIADVARAPNATGARGASFPNASWDAGRGHLRGMSQSSNNYVDAMQYRPDLRGLRRTMTQPSAIMTANIAAFISQMNARYNGSTRRCVFCGQDIPEEIIMLHQRFNCWRTPHLADMQSSLANLSITNAIPAVRWQCDDEIDDDQPSQQRVHVASTELANVRSGSRNTSSSDDGLHLPCEFCQQLFPSNQLLEHQSTCDEHPQFEIFKDLSQRYISRPVHARRGRRDGSTQASVLGVPTISIMSGAGAGRGATGGSSEGATGGSSEGATGGDPHSRAGDIVSQQSDSANLSRSNQVEMQERRMGQRRRHISDDDGRTDKLWAAYKVRKGIPPRQRQPAGHQLPRNNYPQAHPNPNRLIGDITLPSRQQIADSLYGFGSTITDAEYARELAIRRSQGQPTRPLHRGNQRGGGGSSQPGANAHANRGKK